MGLFIEFSSLARSDPAICTPTIIFQNNVASDPTYFYTFNRSDLICETSDMSGEYSVVFTGKTLEGLDKSLVINNIAAKTGLSTEQVIHLFETAPKAVKKFGSNEDAKRLVSVFQSCGAICTVDIAVPDWQLVDYDAENEDKPERKSHKPLLWLTLLILAGAAAYTAYLHLVK